MTSTSDPLRGLRGVFAATLVLEAITIALAIPVVARLGSGLTTVAAWYTVAVAVAMVLAAGVQRARWGLGLALALQLAVLAGWFAHPSVTVIGVIFGLVWLCLLLMRREVARRMAEGTLPGQQGG